MTDDAAASSSAAAASSGAAAASDMAECQWADVARYKIASPGDLGNQAQYKKPPQKVDVGTLCVSGTELMLMGSQEATAWTFELTPDIEVRWAHATVWSGDGLGLLIYDPVEDERWLLVFETFPGPQRLQELYMTFRSACGHGIKDARPDPPVWAARFGGWLYRITARRRDKMMSWSASKGTSIREKSERKLSESAPTATPKKVNPKLKKFIQGVNKSTGFVADAFMHVAQAIGSAMMGVANASAKAAGSRMQPVFHSKPGLASTVVGGSAFRACGNLFTGTAGAVIHIAGAKAETGAAETRHKHGDDVAELADHTIGAIDNSVRAGMIVASHGVGGLAANVGTDAAMREAQNKTVESVAKQKERLDKRKVSK